MFSIGVLKLIINLSGAIALWFLLIVPLWYLGRFLLETQNAYRDEYLQGATISLVLLAPVPVIVFFVSRYLLGQRGL